MNYKDARKDRFEKREDFCYECCLPDDECVCEPVLEAWVDENGNEIIRKPE